MYAAENVVDHVLCVLCFVYKEVPANVSRATTFNSVIIHCVVVAAAATTSANTGASTVTLMLVMMMVIMVTVVCR